MQMRKSRILRAVGGAVAVAIWQPPVNAQTVPAAPLDASQSAMTAASSEQPGVGSTAAADNMLQEITVTANRRVQNVQDVPVAVASVSALTAQHLGVTDTQSLADLVPGLEFNRQLGSSVPFLRGIGSPAGGAGREPSVAVYVDDVYMPYGGAALANFNSIDRIEVEKGPQGTLFGRNATGGVVQVFTKDPNPEPALDVTAGYANYDTSSASMYATGGIADHLSANLALYGANQANGWGTNVTTGHAAYQQWDWGGRAKLLWTPTDRTTVRLELDHDVTSTDEGVDFVAARGTKTSTGVAPPAGFYDINSNLDPNTTVRQQGASVKITQDLDWAKLVSISSDRFLSSWQVFDQDSGPVPIVNFRDYNTDRNWSQELQLLSRAGSAVTWIAGFYTFHDWSAYQPFGETGLAFPFALSDGYSTEITHSYAGFGQATVIILPRTQLTAGLRYTSDTKDLTMGSVVMSKAGVVAPFVSAAGSPQSKSWGRLTDRLVLDYHFTDNLMGYAGYNTGFKSGTFNTVPGAAVQSPVNPETLTAYTIGEKTELARDRLRVNVEGFYYDWKNIQITQPIVGGTLISNAAAATIKGVDLDVMAMPVDNLTLTASTEVMDGHYDSYPDGIFNVGVPSGGGCSFSVVAGGPAPCGGVALPPNYNPATGTWNLRGDKTIQTPSLSLTLGEEYVFYTTAGSFNVNLSWTHTSDYYFDPDNGKGEVSPTVDRQPTINLVNGSIGWNSQNGIWELELWGKNLTGQQYYSFVSESALANYYSAAPPRTFGVTVTAHL
jgi:iron complex outermembrane recepter protein